jgi:rsbT co-antagonist protein RsbR
MPREPRAVNREVRITDEELSRRKAILDLAPEDEARLRRLDELARECVPEIVEGFYRHLAADGESAAPLREVRGLERILRFQVEFFRRLTQGPYDAAYAASRQRVGAINGAVPLPIPLYLGTYAFYVRCIAQRMAEREAPERAIAQLLSLVKLVALDIGLAAEAYQARRERAIRAQEDALRELITPVLPIRPGLLVIPVVGPVDARRARRLTEQLLAAIRQDRARAIVLDLSAVSELDGRAARHLVQAVQASRLMGARAIVAGLSAAVAQALAGIGVDPAQVDAARDIRSGIEAAERFLDTPAGSPPGGGRAPRTAGGPG